MGRRKNTAEQQAQKEAEKRARRKELREASKQTAAQERANVEVTAAAQREVQVSPKVADQLFVQPVVPRGYHSPPKQRPNAQSIGLEKGILLESHQRDAPVPPADGGASRGELGLRLLQSASQFALEPADDVVSVDDDNITVSPIRPSRATGATLPTRTIRQKSRKVNSKQPMSTFLPLQMK